MSNVNLLGSEEWGIVATIDPDANTAGALLSDAVDMSLFEQIMVIVLGGELGIGGTIAVKLTESAASGGTYTDITGKAITTLADSPADGNNDKQAIINLRGDEMTAGMRYVKVSHTVATATSDSAVVVLGKGKSLPASDNDLASVAEIVS